MTKPKIEDVDFNELRKSLYQYARLNLNILDKNRADDLIQDSLLVIVRKFDEFDGASIKAWSQRIMHIEFYKHIAGSVKDGKKNKGYSNSRHETPEILSDENFLPLVMSILNVDEQEYIRAKYIDKLPVKQISEKMKMSRTSLHEFSVKILSKLRKSKLLQDYDLEK